MPGSAVEEVLIHRIGGEIADQDAFAAWLGFTARRLPIRFYDWLDLRDRILEVRTSSLLVGGVEAVRTALTRLGIAPPAPLNLPESLAAYRGRRVWRTTLSGVRRQLLAGEGTPVFIKPASVAKLFRARVVGAPEHLAGLSEHLSVLAADVVEFVSEWRYFVIADDIVGVAHYAGDWSRAPDAGRVRAATRDYAGDAPAAYALDFGVTRGGSTLLVEATDGLSLSCYGLAPSLYADLLEARWTEIVAPLAK